jgi:hypothetical protein
VYLLAGVVEGTGYREHDPRVRATVTARLRLRDQRDGRTHAFEAGPVRVGRAPGSDLVVAG